MQRNARNPLILDGSLGHELRPVYRNVLWSTEALWEEPDKVKKFRQMYLEAGVDILSSLTFRCTRYSFEKAKFDRSVQETANLAIAQAREAVEQSGVTRRVLVSASMAPIEECYTPFKKLDDIILETEHHVNADCFAEAGADLLLVETQNSRCEAVIATKAALSTNLPVWTSLMPLSANEMFNGDPLLDTAHEVIESGVDALLVNCCELRIAAQAFATLRTEFPDTKLGVYPNDLEGVITPNLFSDWAMQFIGKADIIGGCCGIGPAHIKALTDRII